MLERYKNMHFKELFIYIYLYSFFFGTVITVIIDYFDKEFLDLYVTLFTLIFNYFLLIYYNKTKDNELTAILWLANSTFSVIFGIIVKEFSIEVGYLFLIPLSASLILSHRSLILYGSMYIIIVLILFTYGVLSYDNHPFLNNPTILGNFSVLLFFAFMFGLVYHNFIDKSYQELKEANKKLAKSNELQEILLQEVHHRVKNNLNMMSSILGLQADKNNPEIYNLIESNRRRLESIAMVHEILYNNEDFKDINFTNYTDKLSKHILQVYASFSVDIKIDAKNIFLSLEIMVGLGLVLQELLTNSFKYALKENGVIYISLTKEGKKHILIYEDSGNSKDNTDKENQPNTKSLGLSLIQLKIQELDGEMILNKDNGYKYKISFQTK